MKKIIYLLIISVFAVKAVDVTAQNRNVAWVHGLGEGSLAWYHYESIFNNERNINSRNGSFNTGYSINSAASELYNYLPNSWKGNSRNIGIGHSMGGLMIRATDRNHTNFAEKKFGGYITVATPNYGAPIANSLQDGSVQQAKDHGLEMLTAGPNTISPILGITITEMVNASVGNDLAPNPSANIINELEEGSAVIASINNYTNNVNPNIPRISVWANENSPVHWRLASSARYGDDTTIPDQIRIAKTVYIAMDAINYLMGVSCTIGGFWNPWCWGVAASYFYTAAQWRKGFRWLNDSENIWNALIKTTRREEQLFWEQVFVPDSDYDECMSYLDEYDWYADCGTFEWQWVTHMVSVNYPSDGLLPKYTQIMKNNPTPNNEYEVSGANHVQVLDMSTDGNSTDETKDVFDLIFNRGDFFHTN